MSILKKLVFQDCTKQFSPNMFEIPYAIPTTFLLTVGRASFFPGICSNPSDLFYYIAPALGSLSCLRIGCRIIVFHETLSVTGTVVPAGKYYQGF